MAKALVVFPVLLVSLGCAATGAQFYKEVVVKKDGTGKVQSIEIKETINQPVVTMPMVLEYIRLVPINAPSETPTPVELPLR